MRKKIEINPPAIVKKEEENIVIQERIYTLLTPLFGGGVTPREADPVTVIRGTEVRGQLRFWWRATQAGRFSDLTAMKKAEDELWGSAAKKDEEDDKKLSTVQITVESPDLSQLRKIQPFIGDRPNNHLDIPVPAYAAFPLQQTKEERRQKKLPYYVYHDVSFTLTITFPKGQQEEVEKALWAWETFGGIGARTRRGFGALKQTNAENRGKQNLPPSPGEAKIWLQNNLKPFEPSHQSFPHLSRNTRFVIVGPKSKPEDAWKLLIDELRLFRQSKEGRELWLGSDALPSILNGKPRKIPKAAFGLPIIFHFRKDDNDYMLHGVNETKDRFASSLILRPLACLNGQSVGVALVLDGLHKSPDALQITRQTGEKVQYPVAMEPLTQSEAEAIPVLAGEPDVLKAFLNYLERKPR